MIQINAQNRNTNEPIIWEGDLDDDCSANWAGLLLRAEWMNRENWWWCVYDTLNHNVQVDSSNRYEIDFNSGEMARLKAELMAREYLNLSYK